MTTASGMDQLGLVLKEVDLRYFVPQTLDEICLLSRCSWIIGNN
jgi:hypothetical protein